MNVKRILWAAVCSDSAVVMNSTPIHATITPIISVVMSCKMKTAFWNLPWNLEHYSLELSSTRCTTTNFNVTISLFVPTVTSNQLMKVFITQQCSHTLYVPYGFGHTVHRFSTGLACFQFPLFGVKMSSTIPDRRTISTLRLVVLAVVL